MSAKKSLVRASFGSKIGLLLATAGSAVGIGNIWRFPTTAGEGGGGAFILVYLLSVVLLGIPMMVAEFAVGRHSGTNTAEAFRKLTNHAFWRNIGLLGVLTPWFIMCYYVVVSGWTLGYLFDTLAGTFQTLGREPGGETFGSHFVAFISSPWKPVVCMAAFVLASHFVITRGVQRGIERFSKLLMPLLFIIMLLLSVCSLFTDGAAAGLGFLFKPDFSRLTPAVCLSALGQAFYSMSIGMGVLCTYASYFDRKADLAGIAFRVSIIDTLVAILAGVVIFPAVFSAGIQPDSGASLVFVALPDVFRDVFAGIPALGWIVSVMFYALLVLATLTSVISIHEVPTAWLSEELGISRRRATSIVSGVCLVVGAACALSMGPLSWLTIGGKNLFDGFDWVASQVLLPLSGILVSSFVGWVMDRRILREELTNNGTLNYAGRRWLVWMLRYFVPIAIAAVFVSGLLNG